MTIDVVYLAWNRREFTEFSFSMLLRNTNWGLVNSLVVYDDGSTDGTREFLDGAIGGCPVPASLTHVGWRSPTATMNHYVAGSTVDAFAKVDSDIVVPPGWLDALAGVLDRNPRLDLIGAEPSRAGLPTEPDPVYGYIDCSHIGGVGLMRLRTFEGRPPIVHRGRFGFTEFQHRYRPPRGWIAPDLRLCSLDQVPLEPWRTLSQHYLRAGWQRPWPTYDTLRDGYWSWWADA